MSPFIVSNMRPSVLPLQPNAIAALSAGIEVSEQFFNVAVQGGAASKLVALLTAATANPTAASSETKADPSGQIILNSISALGALAEASEAGLQSVVDSGGIPAVTAFCTTQFEPPIQEAAADSICKILASGAAGKEAAEKAGVVPALAQLLSTDAKAAEVTVRALMGLSMVVAGSEAAQIQLASTPGVVKALLALMRQGDDGDCQHIAAGLFSGLASSPASKDAMATAMREAQQQAAENAQYIG